MEHSHLPYMRRRLLYLPLLVIVPLLGLGSRSGASWLPAFIADYAGDTLWATMLYIREGSTST